MEVQKQKVTSSQSVRAMIPWAGRTGKRMILKTAVERFKIPFAQSLSKGEREFESHPMGERRTAAHASTVLSTNGCSAFQLPFLG